MMTNDYTNGTLSLVDEITERFTVEWANASSNGETLTVWVFNYGDIDTVVDIYATVDSDTSSSVLGTVVASENYEVIELSFVGDAIQEDDIVSIQVYSRRQNSAYYTYYK